MYLVEQFVSRLVLAQQGKVDDLVRFYKREVVGIGAEARALVAQ